MATTQLLNLHNLVQVEIEGDEKFHHDFDYYLGDMISQTRQRASAHPSRDGRRRFLRVVHRPSIVTTNMREVSPGLFISGSAAVDTEYRVRIERSEDGILEIQSPQAPVEWFMWLLQLMILQENASFVHCAGVELDGRALIFPSWGGVGKTAITNSLVRDKHWRLLGDDRVILTADGRCYGFPQAMVIYAYHREVFPELFAQGKGPTAPALANELLTKLAIGVKPILRRMPLLLNWIRRHNPQSVRVRPSDVLGSQSLATCATLDACIWIDRDPTICSPKVVQPDDMLVSRIAGSTLSEYDRHCVGLTPALCGAGIVPFESTFAAWPSVVKSALSGRPTWMVLLPADMPVSQVPLVLTEILRSCEVSI